MGTCLDIFLGIGSCQHPLAPKAAPRERGPRENRDNDTFFVPGGFLVHKPSDNSLCAHCSAHGVHKCRRTRTLNYSSRAGAGRCVGHLAAWLASGHTVSFDEHSRRGAIPDFAARAAAREHLLNQGFFLRLFDLENGPAEQQRPYPEPDVCI